MKVEDKSNEITAIPNLLELLDIEGCIITIDAIGTQTQIMNQIKKKKGEFVLPLKKNNQGAYKEVEEYFKDCLELDFYEKIKSKKLEDTITYVNSYGEEFDAYVTRERNQ